MDNNLISPEELKRKLEGDQAPLVVDVRTEEAYQAGHIPGALHIPGNEVEERMAELPKDRLLVFY